MTSGLPLNVDVDTILTVVAGNRYRLLARKLRCLSWPPPTSSTGTSSTRFSSTPASLRDVPIPRWGGKRLRFGFPPR